MTYRTLLNDLLNEIAAVTEYTEPHEDVRPSDTVYSSDCSEDLKKLFTLRQKYGMEVFKETLTQTMLGLTPGADIAKLRLTEFKATLLTTLLWQTIAMQFPSDRQESVGIRKGWVLVNPAPNYSPLADLVEEVELGPKVVN